MRLLWWFSNTIRLRPLFLKYFMFFFSKFSEARHHKITIFLPFPAIFCTFFIAWVPSNLAFSGTKTTRIFHTRMQSCVQSFLKYDFAQWAKNRKKIFSTLWILLRANPIIFLCHVWIEMALETFFPVLMFSSCLLWHFSDDDSASAWGCLKGRCARHRSSTCVYKSRYALSSWRSRGAAASSWRNCQQLQLSEAVAEAGSM